MGTGGERRQLEYGRLQSVAQSGLRAGGDCVGGAPNRARSSGQATARPPTSARLVAINYSEPPRPPGERLAFSSLCRQARAWQAGRLAIRELSSVTESAQHTQAGRASRSRPNCVIGRDQPHLQPVRLLSSRRAIRAQLSGDLCAARGRDSISGTTARALWQPHNPAGVLCWRASGARSAGASTGAARPLGRPVERAN
jgi:hypothetical protein